jgi:hypothetical protein
LAGKVGKNDWRHSVVGGLQSAFVDGSDEVIGADLPQGEFLVFDAVEYTGPFFISCDHGCAHESSGHGNAVGLHHGSGCIQSGPTRADVVQRCRTGIAKAEHFFAWIDDLSAYGTLVEIGIAAALGKPVWLYTHPQRDHDELWFARYAATGGVVSFASTPHAAVRDFISKVTGRPWA